MSHEYFIRCHGCKQTSDRINHGEAMLRAFIESAALVYQISKTEAWEWIQDNSGLAGYIITHFGHGGFCIEGEYKDDTPYDVEVKDAGVHIEVGRTRILEDLELIENRIRLIRKAVEKRNVG